MNGAREPVIGIMARAPVPGGCKTRLAKELGPDAASELYRLMLLDSLDLYAQLPCARHVLLAAPENAGVEHLSAMAPPPWSIVEQVGTGLGARLAHAALALGPGPVLLVSSDSPTVEVEVVARALPLLWDEGQVLLGPCDDGGYYLIGMSAPRVGLFEGIPWSSSQVVSRTLERCEAFGLTVHQLPVCFDVDEPDDIERLRRELGKRPLVARRLARALGIA